MSGILNDLQIRIEKKLALTAHYYGDTVRKLFLFAAIIMLFFLPFLTTYIQIPVFMSLLIILSLGIFSGLTNPKIVLIAALDTVIAIGGVLTFGHFAVEAYSFYSLDSLYFWVNQVLAAIFLVSLYYSTKTIRGFFVNNKDVKKTKGDVYDLPKVR